MQSPTSTWLCTARTATTALVLHPLCTACSPPPPRTPVTAPARAALRRRRQDICWSTTWCATGCRLRTRCKSLQSTGRQASTRRTTSSSCSNTITSSRAGPACSLPGRPGHPRAAPGRVCGRVVSKPGHAERRLPQYSAPATPDWKPPEADADEDEPALGAAPCGGAAAHTCCAASRQTTGPAAQQRLCDCRRARRGAQ